MKMRNRWKILLVLSLVIGISVVCYNPVMETYDDFIDDRADPSYNGPDCYPRYDGGVFEFSVDKEFPCSKLIMIKNSTNRNFTKTGFLYTESNWRSSIGGKNWWLVAEVKYGPDIYEKVEYYIEWWILNYTIRVEDWVWTYYNGTHWIEEYAWFYEYSWELIIELSMWDFPWDYSNESGLFNEQYNITLYADWYGYI
jgi:hypothetical protein